MQKVNEKILFGCRLAILGFAIGFPGIACDPPEEAGDDASSTGTAEETGREGDSTGGEVEHPGSADDVLISEPPEPVGIGQRSCTKENDCIDHCECKQGKCMQPPLLPGPPPPYDMCDEAPTRACNSNAQCQSGCLCQAGVCTDDGVGAVNPSCHLPPPDVYEVDNTWQQWKAYGGPQIHNFHHAGDEDWIAVYFGGAAQSASAGNMSTAARAPGCHIVGAPTSACVRSASATRRSARQVADHCSAASPASQRARS